MNQSEAAEPFYIYIFKKKQKEKNIVKTPQMIYITSGIIQIGVVQEKLQKYW